MFTGKTNACWFGAEASQGRYLLFTDADTVHEPGDLLRALEEIQGRNVGLLSYSPRQVVSGFWQRALMPLVFSELASVYKMADVNDPNKRLAAANGQFLMVEREAYFAVGGHKEVGRSVLEDVDLAYAVKRAGKGIWFRYAPDAFEYAYVLWIQRHGGGVDEEPGAAVSACADAGGVAAAGYCAVAAAYPADSIALFGDVAAGRDSADLGADAGAVLHAGSAIEL